MTVFYPHRRILLKLQFSEILTIITGMKVTIVHGQNHKGSTYHIARMLAEKICAESDFSENIKEFFLPKDFGSFCLGCCSCFKKSESLCPHHAALEPITKSLDEADVIILASPVYVYHATGAMKAFLDHYGYRWMVHSPEGSMFKKQAVCVATAAGAGMKSTIKDMADSLFFWGIARQYKLAYAVKATDWNSVSEKTKVKIEKQSSGIAKKIIRLNGKVKPGIKTKAFFSLMRLMQKNGWNERDAVYWKERGWTEKNRPWK